MPARPKSRRTLEIVNPATEGVLRSLPCDDAGAVGRKYAAARDAQATWAARPVSDRVAVLRRFRDLLGARRDALALTLTAETGKPISQARAEIGATPARLDYFLDHAAAALAPRLARQRPAAALPGTATLEEVVTREPLGVVANISAWSDPYLVGTGIFVPALLCGNTVLYKPSEHATLTGLAMTHLLHEAGVPEAAFAVLVGAGEVGELLLRRAVDGIFFTGSRATGRAVALAAARHLIPALLELGGKDPVYVCPDVDPQEVAGALAEGAFYNTGQSCSAVGRLYVHADLYGAFLHHFKRAVERMRVGAPDEEGTYLGPLARRGQLSELQRQVDDALGKGARLLCGGARLHRRGWYYAPTALVDVDHRMAVMRDESLGPLVGVQRVERDEEAVALMNDTDYGLTAAVYSRDRGRAARVLGRLQTGTAYWNCCDRVSPHLPWSGRRGSGQGATLGEEGLRAFTVPRAWHLRAR